MEKLQLMLERYMEAWADSDWFSGTVLISQGNRILLQKRVWICKPRVQNTKYRVNQIQYSQYYKAVYGSSGDAVI